MYCLAFLLTTWGEVSDFPILVILSLNPTQALEWQFSKYDKIMLGSMALYCLIENEIHSNNKAKLTLAQPLVTEINFPFQSRQQ